MKYYYKFSATNKWIQVEGEGDNPKNCGEITWTASEDNNDIKRIKKVNILRHPVYGSINVNEHYKNDIYAQMMRMAYLIKYGYRYHSGNIPPLNPVENSGLDTGEKKAPKESKESENVNKITGGIEINLSDLCHL